MFGLWLKLEGYVKNNVKQKKICYLNEYGFYDDIQYSQYFWSWENSCIDLWRTIPTQSFGGWTSESEFPLNSREAFWSCRRQATSGRPGMKRHCGKPFWRSTGMEKVPVLLEWSQILWPTHTPGKSILQMPFYHLLLLTSLWRIRGWYGVDFKL